MALICDTGPLLAAADRNEVDHEACATLLSESVERLIVPAPVVVELDWLMTSRLEPAAFDAFLGSVENRFVLVEELTPPDYSRIRQLCRRYSDLALGFVDAAVVSIAERYGETKLATLDRRHFGVIRPRHVRSFTLLPAG